jgi:hypothetical protein
MNGKLWTQGEPALLTSMASQGHSYIDIAQQWELAIVHEVKKLNNRQVMEVI